MRDMVIFLLGFTCGGLLYLMYENTTKKDRKFITKKKKK